MSTLPRSPATAERVLRLEEDEHGEMPLISALASRRSFTGARAARADESRDVVLSGGKSSLGAEGSFGGLPRLKQAGSTSDDY